MSCARSVRAATKMSGISYSPRIRPRKDIRPLLARIASDIRSTPVLPRGGVVGPIAPIGYRESNDANVVEKRASQHDVSTDRCSHGGHPGVQLHLIPEIGRPDKRTQDQEKGYLAIRRAASEAPFASDRKSTRLNSSHGYISYAVFCLKKK